MRSKKQATAAISKIRYIVKHKCAHCGEQHMYVIRQYDQTGPHAWAVEVHCACTIKIFGDAD